MKPLRMRLQEARARLGIPWDVLERDYLLSWILAGIERVESLRESLDFHSLSVAERIQAKLRMPSAPECRPRRADLRHGMR